MRKLQDNKVKDILIIFVLLCLASCEKKQGNEKVDILKSAIQKNLGKKLSIPMDLKTYSPFKGYMADSLQIAHTELKVYTRINTSCPTCIEGLQKWVKLSSELIKYRIPVIVICTSSDNFELMKYLCENKTIKEFPFPFFLDIKNDFINKNPFMKTSTELETVLTDSQDNIILIGNPIHSEDTKMLYLKEIQKRIKKQGSEVKVYEGHPIK